jgi:hypothetical protein
MPEPWALAVLAAAAWRVWMLLAYDGILDAARERLFPGSSRRLAWLRCAYCAGFWVALGWWAAWWVDDRALYAAALLALSAGLIVFDKIMDVLEKHGE